VGVRTRVWWAWPRDMQRRPCARFHHPAFPPAHLSAPATRPGRRRFDVHDLVQRCGRPGAGLSVVGVRPGGAGGGVSLDGRPCRRLVRVRTAAAHTELDGRPATAGGATSTPAAAATHGRGQFVGGPAEAGLDGGDVEGAGPNIFPRLLRVLHSQGERALRADPVGRLWHDAAVRDAHGLAGVVKSATEAVEEGPQQAAAVVVDG